MKSAANKKSPIFSFKYFFYDFTKVTAAIPGLLFYRPKLVYENKEARKLIKGGALIIANHSSFADPIILMIGLWYRRHHFVATTELFNTPVKKFFFTNFMCIPIDKNNFGFGTFREITKHLKAEELVSMFPEGAVGTNEGQMKTFKSGMILMSLQANKPIVPVFIKKQEHWYNRVVIAIGEKIDLVKEYGPNPPLDKIENITQSLYHKEEMLKQLTVKHLH